jgi:hypothetical protein
MAISKPKWIIFAPSAYELINKKTRKAVALVFCGRDNFHGTRRNKCVNISVLKKDYTSSASCLDQNDLTTAFKCAEEMIRDEDYEYDYV